MKSKQAGGIVSFIIVALALAGLLAGGLYFSKQQARTARESDTSGPQISTTQTKTQDKKDDEKNAGTSSEAGSTGTPAPQQNAPKPSQGQTPTTPTPSNPSSNRVANTGPSENLPSTGPTETATVGLALGALVFTGYRLIDSRRTLRRSALRR